LEIEQRNPVASHDLVAVWLRLRVLCGAVNEERLFGSVCALHAAAQAVASLGQIEPYLLANFADCAVLRAFSLLKLSAWQQ
jgi:hypothetical protein